MKNIAFMMICALITGSAVFGNSPAAAQSGTAEVTWVKWRKARVAQMQSDPLSPIALVGSRTLRKDERLSVIPRGRSMTRWTVSTLPSRVSAFYPGGNSLLVKGAGSRQNIRQGRVAALDNGIQMRWQYALPFEDRAMVHVYDDRHLARDIWPDLQKWFPYNDAYRVQGRFKPLEGPERGYVDTALGRSEIRVKVGHWEATINNSHVSLPVYTRTPAPRSTERVFIAFKDQSSGRETYRHGRAITHIAVADLQAPVTVVDFNYAHNMDCAYSRLADCPLIDGSTIALKVQAGEKRPSYTLERVPDELILVFKSSRAASRPKTVPKKPEPDPHKQGGRRSKP